MEISKGYVLEPPVTRTGLHGPKANILIGYNGRACVADFSLLTVISDQQSFLSTCREGGTIPWMSPELLDPESFGLKESRLTKESDCYALGMVIYEILSGRAPFAPSMAPVVKILFGERPEKPRGSQGAWLTDSIWGMLELCWRRQPGDRPSPNTVLQCLRGIVPPSRPPPHTNEDVEKKNQSDITSSDSSVFPLFRSRSQSYACSSFWHHRLRLHVV